MEPKKLKIYDLDALLRSECKKEAFRYQKVAIFEGPRGVVVAEQEAVHKKEASLSATIDIEANDPARPGTVWLMPSYIITIAISDVKEAPFTEMSMESFFSRRDYNPRCQSNWRILLASLDSIGFDLSEYLPVKEPLGHMIQTAERQKGEGAAKNRQPLSPER